MYIPICVGHLSNWAIRVGQGKHSSECLACEHTCTFYASDRPLPGMEPVSIGQTGGGHYDPNWRHSVLRGPNANGPGWAHAFTFYAYMTPMPGTIPIAIGHAANESGGWKYRLSENTSYAGDNGWTHDFVFYVPSCNPDSLVPVSIGYNDHHWTYKVKKGVSVRNHPWKHHFTIQALTEPAADTFPVAIGYTGSGDSHRSRISQGTNAGTSGWNHEFVIYLFNQQKPGTVPVAIGHADFAYGGWKYRMSPNTDAGGNGWTHDFVGYTYLMGNENDNGTVPISVGYESRDWCTLVRRGEKLQEYGYTHSFGFDAFSTNAPGTIPVSVGDAGTPGHDKRSRIDNGPNAGSMGWTHNFTFYAYGEQRPGTEAFSVGHADCAFGGWKYRIVQRPNGGGDGWSHDFTFYAYPAQ